jgi:hypothetical protein
MDVDIRQRASFDLSAPISPFRASTKELEDASSPSVRAATFDGIKFQTALQSAMVRERVFLEACKTNEIVPPFPTESSGLFPPAAGRRSGNNTAWGTIRVPGNEPNGHVPSGVRSALLPEFHASLYETGPNQAKYALGMQSSVVFSAVEPGAVAQAYPKHLGEEPKLLAVSGAVAMVTDRAPESVLERRRRRHLHRNLLSGRDQPFSRRMLVDSLSEYAQERCTMTKIIGETHQPGDLADVGPPRVKLHLHPDANPHIAFVKADTRYGRRPGDSCVVDPYDYSLDPVRPRTVGYSPGHVRTVSGSGPGSPLSSTARRTIYTNELHAAIHARQRLSREALDSEARSQHIASIRQVEGEILAFEANIAMLKSKGWKGV